MGLTVFLELQRRQRDGVRTRDLQHRRLWTTQRPAAARQRVVERGSQYPATAGRRSCARWSCHPDCQSWRQRRPHRAGGRSSSRPHPRSPPQTTSSAAAAWPLIPITPATVRCADLIFCARISRPARSLDNRSIGSLRVLQDPALRIIEDLVHCCIQARTRPLSPRLWLQRATRDSGSPDNAGATPALPPDNRSRSFRAALSGHLSAAARDCSGPAVEPQPDAAQALAADRRLSPVATEARGQNECDYARREQK